MLGYNFTERVRRSLARAREESGRLNHEYVGTEHMLLGLIADSESIAASALQELAIDPKALRQKVEQVVKPGHAKLADTDLPYTSRAKKVLERAMMEAHGLKHSYVGTGHLLLGILSEGKGIGAQVLVDAGAEIGRAREIVLRLSAGPGAESAPPAPYMLALPSGPMFTRLLLSISAGLAWLLGVILIFDAMHSEARMGIITDDKTAMIAQAQGAILLGLGFINWLARDVTDRRALWAILYGNFVIQVVSFAVVLRALVHGYAPISSVGAAVLHALLGAAFAWQLRKIRRSS